MVRRRFVLGRLAPAVDGQRRETFLHALLVDLVLALAERLEQLVAVDLFVVLHVAGFVVANDDEPVLVLVQHVFVVERAVRLQQARGVGHAEEHVIARHVERQLVAELDLLGTELPVELRLRRLGRHCRRRRRRRRGRLAGGQGERARSDERRDQCEFGELHGTTSPKVEKHAGKGSDRRAT